jgi:hypothetical protein
MNSEIVYQVVKALSKEEQILLFDKLKADFKIKGSYHTPKKVTLFRKQDAIQYLLKSVFKRNI